MGMKPGRISTIDQYQGQQNDYILLSLVRTKSLGYLRDVRRWIVALSRARLGLYVTCRKSLFSTCAELDPIIQKFNQYSDKLILVKGESYMNQKRKLEEDVSQELLYEVNDVSDLGSLVFSLQEQLVENL